MSKNNIENIDKNFHVDKVISKDGLKFIEVRNEPFKVYGLYDYKNQAEYRRMPDDVARNVSENVAHLCKCTAGGRVRFSTDSRYIAVKAVLPGGISHMTNMCIIGSSGLDLYVDEAEDAERGYFRSFIPPAEDVDEFESKLDFKVKKMRSFTINMPPYNRLTNLYIGVDEDAVVCAGEEYRPILPIVYYGSSITQGGCASRPGNIYQNIISRRLNIDYINLGFSGNAKGEPAIAEYMAGLSMSVFVSDYDHNAPTFEHLTKTHFALYQTIREKNPELPYIMITKPDYWNHRDIDEILQRREHIMENYNKALALGDKNVYFIDGMKFFTGKYADMCTVDGTHPNDLGFSLMADRIGDVLEGILGK